MTTPLQSYRSTTYDLTLQKLQKQALERQSWLDEKLKKANQPTRSKAIARQKSISIMRLFG